MFKDKKDLIELKGFNSRDYYQGELDELDFIIRVLKAPEDSKFLEYFLNSYLNYKVEE